MESTDSSPKIRVGRPSLEGNIQRYARAFDLLEVLAERGRHPRRPGLLEWRAAVGDQFTFTAIVPAQLAAFEAGKQGRELIEHARMVADALQASFWLLRTPPTVTPSARAMREIEGLVNELRSDGRRVAWEPRGLWGDEGALELSTNLGIHLVQDLARDERLSDDPVVYTRLRALGEGARIGAAAAERVADRLEDAEEAYVVVEGTGAGRVRSLLRETFGVGAPGTAGVGENAESDDVEEAGEGEGEGGFDDAEGDDEDEDEDE